jgi:hypothetical protein
MATEIILRPVLPPTPETTGSRGAAPGMRGGDGAIYRVDVFLRPATVLDAVHQAMVTAWP